MIPKFVLFIVNFHNFAIQTFPSLPLSSWGWNGRSAGETICIANTVQNISGDKMLGCHGDTLNSKSCPHLLALK